MVIDARSSYLSTNNDGVAYQIILDETAISESDNTSTCKIRVEAWSWSYGPTFSYSGQCDLWIRDSYHGDWDMVSNGWDSGEKTIQPGVDTTVLELSDEAAVVVEHEATGYCKMEIWARLRFWKNGQEVIYSQEEWQGYDVILTQLQGKPQLGISCQAKSKNSIQINLTASQVCNRWWYSLDNGENWVEFAQGTEGRTVSTTVNNLVPRFTYPVQGCARVVDGTDDFYSKTFNVKTNGNTRDVTDRIAIFNPTDRSFSTNGLGSLSDATSCTVTEERNGSFELELKYPINGQNYEYLRYDYIIVANSNPYDDPEPFRIYSISKPINGIVTVNAAHISYDLSKWSVSPFSATSTLWNTLIQMGGHIDGVQDFPFSVGTDVMFQDEDIDLETYYPRSYRSIIGEGDESIIAKWNCEMMFKEYTIWYLKARGSDNGVTIRYSKNMTDFKLEGNSDNMCNAIRAFWYKEIDKDADWYEENKTKGLVETEPKLISIGEPHPGYPNKVYFMDLSSEEFKETYWDEKAEEYKERDKKPTPTELRDRVREIWSRDNMAEQLLKPQVNITVSFVNVYDSDEYKDLGLQDLEKVRLCDIVTVIFPGLLGEDDYTEENDDIIKMKCVKTVYNVIRKRYDSIELGMINDGLASTISGQSHSISNGSASTSHGSYSSGGSSGSSSDSTNDKNYIFLDYSNGPGKLLSMDTETATGAANVLKMNNSGISHSSDGVNGNYETLISQSGSINANAIRTGSFDGGIIKPGTITKGHISDEYDKYVDGEIEKESKNIMNNTKYSDSQIRNIHNMMYTDGVNIGKGRFVKVFSGVDFIINN